jgi:cell shape-determining protein MreC
MSYLLDKKNQRKKIFYTILGVFFLCLLVYFRAGIESGLSKVSHTIFRPFLVVGNNFSLKINDFSGFFSSKNSLYLENQNLKYKITEQNIRMSDRDTLAQENMDLKYILERKNPKTPMILSAILSKPNISPYDTLVIDVGEKDNIKVGDTVFAFGSVPIGRIAQTYSKSSKVVLFSNSGEKTEVVVSRKSLPAPAVNIFLEALGRGGGNFEIILPRDFTLVKGDELILPGITPHVLGVVESIISDPRDPFVKALLVSPVNVQDLKFVEVAN